MNLIYNKDEILELKQRRAKLMSAVASLDDAIKILEGNAEKPVDWKNSALECLRRNGHPMRTVDILNCMFYNDLEKLSDAIKRRNCVSALSIALNNLCDKEVLGRLQIPGFKGFFYGSIFWFYPQRPVLFPNINDLLMKTIWSDDNSVFKLSKTEVEMDDDGIIL